MTFAIVLLILGCILWVVGQFVFDPKKNGDVEFGDYQFKTTTFRNWFQFIAYGFGLVFLIITTVCSFYVVQPGQVGVEVLFGKVQKYAESGFNFRNPFSEVIFFDIRTMKFSQVIEGASQDLQEVKVSLSINYRLDFTKISRLFSEVGKDYEDKVIAPGVLTLTKASISKFKVEDVIVKRTELAEMVKQFLSERLGQYFVILETVNIENISFSDEFTKVVEQKQIEEQKIKTAEYVKEQAKQKAEQTVIEAKATAEQNLIEARAEAEKQRLLRQNTSSEVIALKWIDKWKGDLPTYMTGNGAMFMINPKVAQ